MQKKAKKTPKLKVLKLPEKPPPVPGGAVVPIDPNTRKTLLDINAALKLLEEKKMIIMQTFVNARGLNGPYTLSNDCSMFVRTKE